MTRAELDQVEQQARELSPHLARLADEGPDGSAADARLAQSGIRHLLVLLEGLRLIREAEVLRDQLELQPAGAGDKRGQHDAG